jgi:hypothetical protein
MAWHTTTLDIQTWPRGEVPGLGLTDEDIDLLRGVGCDILALMDGDILALMDGNILTQVLIELIECPCHQDVSFFESLCRKNLFVKRAWPRAILGWVTYQEVFSCVHE